MSRRYDVVVVGGGHNALVAAAYLARAGRSVVVCERAAGVGGAAATREFAPGFRASAAFQSAETLSPRIVQELDLERHGLQLLPAGGVALAAAAGWLWFDGKGRHRGGRLADADAAALGDLEREIADLGGVFAPLYEAPLPHLEDLGAGGRMNLLRLAFRLRKLGRKRMRNAMRALPMSMRDFVEERLVGEAARALIAGLGSAGGAPGPFAAGTLFRALHDQLPNPRPVLSGPVGVRGGLGGLAAALRSAAAAAGVEVRVDAEVTGIHADAGAVRGVTLASGEHLDAPTVLSGLGAATTLLGLLDGGALTPEFAFAARNARARPGVALVSYALRELPERPSGVPPEVLAARIQLGDTLADIERGFDDAPAGRLPQVPFVQLMFPSIADRTLVDGEEHVATAWVQAVPGAIAGAAPGPPSASAPSPANATSPASATAASAAIAGDDSDGWALGREALADAVSDAIEAILPGFAARVVAREVAAPPDFERRLGVENGCLLGADISLDQALYLRPIAGWYGYAMPVDGLYLCGSATHGGGGITGLAGRNAARQVIAQARKGRG